MKNDIKYKQGKMRVHITESVMGYYMCVVYNHIWVAEKWYTCLSSAKRGLERALTDLAVSAEGINYKRAMEEAGCE